MKIIFIAAIILLVIVFVFFSYRKINLLIILLTRGRYHHKYLSLHKRYFNTNPHAYCIKEDFFTRIMPFLTAKQDTPVITANKNDFPEKFPFFSEFREVKKAEGHPVCYQSYLEFETDLKIMGYEAPISGHSVKKIYYFIDNLLFMTELVINETGNDSGFHFLDNLFGIHENANTTFPKSFFIEQAGVGQIHFRDAAFSKIIAHFSVSHPQVKTGLDKVKKGMEERRRNFGNK